MEAETPKRKRGPLNGSTKDRPAITSRATKTPEGLTIHQEAYARARAMGMTLTEAAAACNLSPLTCRSWDREQPWVGDRINELSAIATSNAIIKTGINREWVITRLMSVVDRCMQAEPVMTGKGEPTGEYKFDASGANQALRMLGDTMGMFKPVEKKDDDYANLSDADLARIAHELAAQTGLLENRPGIEAPAGSQQVIDVQAIP